MHRRQVIRDALVEVLSSGVPEVQGRVFPMRARILGPRELPAIRVYTPSDQADRGEPGMMLSGATTYRVECRIELLVKMADDVEVAVDALAESVELALAADPQLGGAVQWITYQSTDVDFEDEDETVMQAAITFEAEFTE
jgi:hypothetical protein